MLKSVLSYNPLGKTFLAFEHTERENNSVIIGIELQQKKDELDITQYFILTDTKEISDHIKISKKANLIITDSNTLHKEVHATGTDQEILSEAYPNLNLDDFYYQILKTNTKSFIAVCRKQYIETLIAQYKKENILITEIDLGSLKTVSLPSYIKDSEVLTYNSSIRINDGEISSIQPNKDLTENYEIDTIKIPSTHTLPFASILVTVAGQSSISGNTDNKNKVLQQYYKESQFFKKTAQYGIGFLLVSLLINFFVFSSTYKTWQELQEEQQVYTTQKESIRKQQSVINAKEAIVNSILTTGFSESSYYIDQIIQSQPTTIILKSCRYQPIAKTIRADKPITLKDDTIVITGNSSDKTSFTAWLNTIENLDFVDTVTIINYGLDKKNNSIFEIAIHLIHDAEK